MARAAAAVCLLLALPLVSARAADAGAGPEAAAALAEDDECGAGGAGGCSLSALQVRGSRLVGSEDPNEALVPMVEDAFPVDESVQNATRGDDEHEEYEVDIPNSSDSPNTSEINAQSYHGCGCCCHHEEKISDPWKSCAAHVNSCCHSCGVWSALHSSKASRYGGHGVRFVGEKVTPTRPIGGMEGITAYTAGGFNFLWNAAAGKAGYSSQRALVANPWLSRTQHQMHILVKWLDGRGAGLADRLARSTGCKPGNWFNAHFACRHSKARLFSRLPGVFSEAWKLASTGAMGHLTRNPRGEATLATVGISVLFICGGKPLVLATGNGNGYCSIEHSIA